MVQNSRQQALHLQFHPLQSSRLAFTNAAQVRSSDRNVGRRHLVTFKQPLPQPACPTASQLALRPTTHFSLRPAAHFALRLAALWFSLRANLQLSLRPYVWLARWPPNSRSLLTSPALEYESLMEACVQEPLRLNLIAMTVRVQHNLALPAPATPYASLVNKGSLVQTNGRT